MDDRQTASDASAGGTEGRSAFYALVIRLWAYFFDCCLLLTLVIASQLALLLSELHPFGEAIRSGTSPPPLALHAWVFVSTTVPFTVYFGLGFSSVKGGTLGQKLTGIAVRDLRGARLEKPSAIARALVLLLPFEINHATIFHAPPWSERPTALFAAGMAVVWFLCILYVMLPLIRSDRRSVHDLVAGSKVLLSRSSG